MSAKMLCVIKKEAAPGAEFAELDVPTPGPGEALIKVRAASICGTDHHIYSWDPWAQKRIKPPMVFGHECCGTVVETGHGCKNVKAGDSVSLETHIPCGHCAQCLTGNMHLCANVEILGVDRNGVFAEYVAVPEIVCWKNDPGLSPVTASIQEPFGNATYCVMEGNVSLKKIAIIGDGPIACFACGIAKAVGAAVIYNLGMIDFNLDIARKMGAHISVNVEKDKDYIRRIVDETNGGVDVVLDMAGNQAAIRDGLALLKRTGTFIAFGIPSRPIEVDYAEGLVFKGANLIAINGRKMFETWFQVKALLDYKLVDPSPVITHVIPFKDALKGLDLVCNHREPASKLVFNPMPSDA